MESSATSKGLSPESRPQPARPSRWQGKHEPIRFLGPDRKPWVDQKPLASGLSARRTVGCGRPPSKQRNQRGRLRCPDGLGESMALLNRCAVAVAPRQPMLDWSRAYWTREEREDRDSDSGLYLIPIYDNREQAMDCLRQAYGWIFAAELDLWCNNQSLWPSPRSFKLFQQWFSLCFYPLVEDIGRDELRAYQVDEGFPDRLRRALA